jgi:hypothetical protein
MATYFVSEITIVLVDDPGMRTWRKRLFSRAVTHVEEPGRFLRAATAPHR